MARSNFDLHMSSPGDGLDSLRLVIQEQRTALVKIADLTARIVYLESRLSDLEEGGSSARLGVDQSNPVVVSEPAGATGVLPLVQRVRTYPIKPEGLSRDATHEDTGVQKIISCWSDFESVYYSTLDGWTQTYWKVKLCEAVHTNLRKVLNLAYCRANAAEAFNTFKRLHLITDGDCESVWDILYPLRLWNPIPKKVTTGRICLTDHSKEVVGLEKFENALVKLIAFKGAGQGAGGGSASKKSRGSGQGAGGGSAPKKRK